MDTNKFLNNFPDNPKKRYSQTGEEGILEYIFSNIGTTNKYLVDFGAGDGFSLSNTQLFLENEWEGLRMDGKGTGTVKKEFITAENIIVLFQKYEVPQSFDLLSIDMDGNDYWVLKEILAEYKPLVIVAEINGCLEPNVSKAMKYNPTYVHQNNDYYGASFEAFKRLCTDYVIVYNRYNLNIFLVHKDVIGDIESPVTAKRDQYHIHSPNREWVLNPETVTLDLMKVKFEAPKSERIPADDEHKDVPPKVAEAAKTKPIGKRGRKPNAKK